jgi:hypothetical protein
LDLSRNQIGIAGAKMLANFVRENRSQSQSKERVGLGLQGANALIESLMRIHSVNRMDISNNNPLKYLSFVVKIQKRLYWNQIPVSLSAILLFSYYPKCIRV